MKVTLPVICTACVRKCTDPLPFMCENKEANHSVISFTHIGPKLNPVGLVGESDIHFPLFPQLIAKS